MAKRSLIVFALTLVLVTSAVPVRHVHGILMTPDEVAMLDASSRDDDGQFELGREGGQSERRIVHAGDISGREIERALLDAVRS